MGVPGQLTKAARSQRAAYDRLLVRLEVGYQSLSGYLRDLMDADAAAETNAEAIDRIARDREPAMNCGQETSG